MYNFIFTDILALKYFFTSWFENVQHSSNYNNELLWLLNERLGTVMINMNVYVVYSWNKIDGNRLKYVFTSCFDYTTQNL